MGQRYSTAPILSNNFPFVKYIIIRHSELGPNDMWEQMPGEICYTFEDALARMEELNKEHEEENINNLEKLSILGLLDDKE